MTPEEYHKSYTQRLMKLQMNKDLLRVVDMLNIILESIAAGDEKQLRSIIGYLTLFMLSKGAFGVHVSNDEAYMDLMELLMDCYLSKHDDMTPEQFIQMVQEEKSLSRDYLLKILNK